MPKSTGPSSSPNANTHCRPLPTTVPAFANLVHKSIYSSTQLVPQLQSQEYVLVVSGPCLSSVTERLTAGPNWTQLQRHSSPKSKSDPATNLGAARCRLSLVLPTDLTTSADKLVLNCRILSSAYLDSRRQSRPTQALHTAHFGFLLTSMQLVRAGPLSIDLVVCR